MKDSLPSSVKLTSLERQTLQTIVANSTQIERQVWREQAILLLEQGGRIHAPKKTVIHSQNSRPKGSVTFNAAF